jgi:hypothetical protein
MKHFSLVCGLTAGTAEPLTQSLKFRTELVSKQSCTLCMKSHF